MAGDVLERETVGGDAGVRLRDGGAGIVLAYGGQGGGEVGGAYAIVDLGAEVCGYLVLEVEAERDGVVIDIAHGEHLADGRVRCWVGGRNFADRYVCRAGRQRWLMPMRKLGCRYLELHVSGELSGAVRLVYAGVRGADYPVERRGDFGCDGAVHERVLAVAERTMRLCMHEHYEDCPWREQGLYAFDSRLQALFGYYLFGEYDFPRESWRLLGQGVREDGYLELCAPAKVPLTIPGFSMAWICAVRDHWWYSGDEALVREFGGQMAEMLRVYSMSRRDERGVMVGHGDRAYWDFYEWAEGLDGGGGLHSGAGEPSGVVFESVFGGGVGGGGGDVWLFGGG